MSVTIRDVAGRAGVSKATVSYVLNGRAGEQKIPAETVQRVLDAAQELQYRPNALARGLAGAGTRAVRVVLQYAQWFTGWDGFTSEMLRGLASAAYDADLELVLHTRRSAQVSRESELAHLLDGRTDGAVLFRNYNDPLIAELADRDFPFVLMFSRVADPRVATVDCDNTRGGQIAADYLLDLGHRRILHVAGGQDDSSPGVQRRQGFEDALRARGIAPRPDWIVEAWQGSSPAALAPIGAALSLPPAERPTAVFAWYDGAALPVLEMARHLGLRVPDDLSVIGFDGTDLGAHLAVPLTSIRQPIAEIAGAAIRRLDARLRHAPPGDARQLFAPELLVRASCAAPPG